MPLERNQDYMNVCNPDQGKYKPEIFEQEICRQCSRPECIRSAYQQSATDKRLERAEGLTTFIDPGEAPESPLSHYPEELDADGKYIHRAEVAGTLEAGAAVDEAAQALAQLQEPSRPREPEAPTVPEVTEPTPEPPRPKDPWQVPDDLRMNIYKEYEDPKEDPWSVEYEGPRSIKAEPGVTITLSGRRKK